MLRLGFGLGLGLGLKRNGQKGVRVMYCALPISVLQKETSFVVEALKSLISIRIEHIYVFVLGLGLGGGT